MTGEPIEGQVLLLAAAKASVGPRRLPVLVDRVQAELAGRRDEYAREYERAYAADDHEAYFVPDGHWVVVGERVGLATRETDAVRRAHHEQLRRTGRRRDRREEFETALDVRDCVLIGTS